MKIALISNYLPDRQESMLRFARVLQEHYLQLGHSVQLIHPTIILGRLGNPHQGLGKWLGYIDKFILFVPKLWFLKADIIHICDHSNSIYIPFLRNKKHLITCHDLLAVRGALGEVLDCPASGFGYFLQKLILKCLKKSQFVVCDSWATERDLVKLTKFGKDKVSVIYLGLNFRYSTISSSELQARLGHFRWFTPSIQYLFHVGSSLKRKNRDGVIRIFSKIKDTWPGVLVFAGQPLTPALVNLANELNIFDRIVQIEKPDNQTLEALYNRAFALIFPSTAEGFGWPILEAQSCGCPVICSDQTSVPEVAGKGAIVCPLHDEERFAQAILSLEDSKVREELIKKGFDNLAKFTTENMIFSYLRIYREILGHG